VAKNVSYENNNIIPNSSSSVVSQKFAGIFDGAALGSWICGIDPRNKFGFTKIHSRDLIDGKVWLVDPSIGTYEFNSKSELELNVDGRKICIYNLHIHSKNLLNFSPYNLPYLESPSDIVLFEL
jgi:hypothetical protein